jgi:hypothetical protein
MLLAGFGKCASPGNVSSSGKSHFQNSSLEQMHTEPTGCKWIRIAASQKNSQTFNVLESLMSSVCFDVEHLYYLTQYLPVYRELRHRGVEVQFLLHHSEVSAELASAVEEREGIEFHWCKNSAEMIEFYKTGDFDWIVFGNGCQHIAELPQRSRTAQLYHGIGMKNGVYKSEIMRMDVRFVEGPYYTEELNRLFPGCNLQEVGYAKWIPCWVKILLTRFRCCVNGNSILTNKPFCMLRLSFPAPSNAWPMIFLRTLTGST